MLTHTTRLPPSLRARRHYAPAPSAVLLAAVVVVVDLPSASVAAC
jgi:hypothetical protein